MMYNLLKNSFQLMISNFDLCTTLSVVSGGNAIVGTILSHHFFKLSVVEMCSSIANDCPWDTKS